jgi:hypothetical protein
MEDAMKKTIVSLLIIGLVFFLGSCNDPDGSDGVGGAATDVIWTWGQTIDGEDTGTLLDLTEDSNNYPGRSMTLAECRNISGPTEGSSYVLGDISNYGEAILIAILYDEDDNEIPTRTSLAQFSILKENTWSDGNKLAEAYNLTSREPRSAVPGSDSKYAKSGMPLYLLVQGSYNQGDYVRGTSVAKVRVQKLTLKLRTDLPVFVEAYDNGSYMTITNGNKITFTNSTYFDSGARYDFSDDVISAGFVGKNVLITWKIEDFDSTKSYQIHIQAANGPTDYNSRHPQNESMTGQFYFILNDKAQSGNGTGTITLSGTALQAATDFNSSSDSGNSGPNFPLTAIRLVNNGKNESPVGQMETSYTLVIESIKVQ